MLNDGIHEAIISEEMWNQAHRKRQETGVLQVKHTALNMSIFYLELSNVLSVEVVCMAM